MAKRKYSELEDDNLQYHHYPAKTLRLFTSRIERVNDVNSHHHISVAKPKRKKNRFDVDSLLAERTKEVEIDEHPSPTLTPTYILSDFDKSAFRSLHRKKEDLNYENYVPIHEACTKSCCIIPRRSEVFDYRRYPGNIHLCRARETGSNDSSGSHPFVQSPIAEDFERLSRLRRRDFLHREELYRGEKLRFPYEYPRPEDMDYLQEERKSCACAECHLKSDEFFHRRRTSIGQFKQNIHNVQVKEKNEKPLSKRRVVIDKLEKSGHAQTIHCGPTNTIIKEEIIDVENDDVITDTFVKQKNEEEISKKVEYDVQPDLSIVKNEKRTVKSENKADILKMLPAPGTSRNRAVANLLERRRVAELNTAFEQLRILIPSYGDEDRALSKIKTLKYALTYMTHLMAVLREPSSIESHQDPLFRKCREHMSVRKIF